MTIRQISDRLVADGGKPHRHQPTEIPQPLQQLLGGWPPEALLHGLAEEIRPGGENGWLAREYRNRAA